MAVSVVQRIVDTHLTPRILADGGVADRPGGQFQVGATAWGIWALRVAGKDFKVIEQSRMRLKAEQRLDGRVSVDRAHEESYWPTAVAVLAWQGSHASQEAQSRAIHFLLDTFGVPYRRNPDAPSAHDPLLKGWSWIDGTHSWVEPTALTVMALKATGHKQHDRVREAIRMMLDRQLPHGGWNYGNTLLFGRELHPMPESTGAALAGLAGVVDRDRVSQSLDYLQSQVARLRTPISLGWSLLGLAAWDRWPSNGEALVERCLANQSRYGDYDTAALCLLFLGALAGETNTKTALFSHSSHDQAPAVPTQ